MATDTLNHEAEDEDIDAIYERILSCEPALPPNEMEQMADLVFSNERVVRQWRFTAMLASKEGAFFRELSEDAEKAKVFAPTVETLKVFATLLREVAKLADCAAARVAVAGCNHQQFLVWAKQAD